ncbi:MAG: hypothetical protein ABL993_14685 [Vicinamibacterales bacterium]
MKAAVAMVLLLAAVVGLQALREQSGTLAPQAGTGNLLYVRSGEFMTRAVLSFDSLAADVYWIRAVQHYGRSKLSGGVDKKYDILYPLLDLTTALDPKFDIAYRFGAVFLAERPPAGPGRPDQAIALLERGLRAQPGRWQLAQDLGFVHYWYLHDYLRAAEWFKRSSEIPGAPNWLAPLAAVTLAQGGSRGSSRQLWQQVLESADADWLRVQARFRLRQLDAMDQIAALEQAVKLYERRIGSLPMSWADMVRTGDLRGIPVDSERHPFELNPFWGTVTLDRASPLNPLPAPEQPR